MDWNSLVEKWDDMLALLKVDHLEQEGHELPKVEKDPSKAYAHAVRSFMQRLRAEFHRWAHFAYYFPYLHPLIREVHAVLVPHEHRLGLRHRLPREVVAAVRRDVAERKVKHPVLPVGRGARGIKTLRRRRRGR